MKVFTIENETNNITVHATVQDAEAVANAERFRNEAGLAKLAADWPMARLVEIWNSLAGVSPVAKFKDRSTGVSRIWKQIQSLEPAAGTELAPELTQEQSPAAEPAQVEASSAETASDSERPTAEVTSPGVLAAELPGAEQQSEEQAPAPVTDVAPQGANVATEATPSGKNATRRKKTSTEPAGAKAPRESSKTAQVIALLKRADGTTVEEIMTAMGWLKHTTRAMLSAGGSLTKNHGLVITSEKVGEHRRYSIKA
jgi:hypothetical protein